MFYNVFMNESSTRLNNFCLIVLTAVALTTALIYTRTVLLPFVISLFIFSIISPTVRFLQAKARVPRLVAIGLSLIVYFVFTGTLIFFVTNSLDSFIRSAGVYRDNIVDFIQWGTTLAEKYGFQVEDRTLREEIKNLPIFGIARHVTGNALSFLGNSTLIFIFVMFLIAGEKAQTVKDSFYQQVQNKISKYLITKTVISTITGILVGIILMICGVELAFMFAVLTVLFNFIPSIGSIIATLIPLPVVLLQFGFTWPFYVALFGCGLIQFTIGNIIEPKFMGESMDLHPVSVLMFLMFWGLVWGLPGMFMAVPITAVLKIVLSRMESTKVFAELLAGRLPSSLFESSNQKLS